MADLSSIEKASALVHGAANRGPGTSDGPMDTTKIEQLLAAIVRAAPELVTSQQSAVPYVEALVLLIKTGGQPTPEQWDSLEAMKGGQEEAQKREAAEKVKLELELEDLTGGAALQPEGPGPTIKEVKKEAQPPVPKESPVNPLLRKAVGQETQPAPAVQTPNSPALNDGLPGEPKTPSEEEQKVLLDAQGRPLPDKKVL